MTANELVATLQARGVRLEVSGDKLRYFPRDAVSPDLLRKLVARKSEVLEILRCAVETIECPGCTKLIKLVAGQGWCLNHKMTISVHYNVHH